MDNRYTEADSTTSEWNNPTSTYNSNTESNLNNNAAIDNNLQHSSNSLNREGGYDNLVKDNYSTREYKSDEHPHTSSYSSEHQKHYENNITTSYSDNYPSSTTLKREDSTNNRSTSSNISNGNSSVPPMDLKKAEQFGKQHAEDIITKAKRVLRHQFERTQQSVQQVHKKAVSMVPPEGKDLVYWKRPIHTGVVFGILLASIITFMFLSSLAAISFWLLALLIIIGLHKLYNYVMTTFLGRDTDDLFGSLVPLDVSVSQDTARAISDFVHKNGTKTLKMARHLFLWENLTDSVIFGFVLFIFFYIGLSMNALTLALVVLLFSFTVPKIYQVYQVPIDRTAKNILDKINQLLTNITSKLPSSVKAKKP